VHDGDEGQHAVIEEVVTPGNLTELRTELMRLSARAGLDAERSERFVLAVHEAVANAIEHAGGKGEVAVIKDDQERLIAEVTDAGPGIPCSVTVTLPPLNATGGRGLWLVQELTDHVQVRTGESGTTVRLEMSLPPHPDPEK